ncbi:aminoglycoside phosphotransferase family protein [Streptomyces catenulae]|uniref:Aminoglycoside phosphotransferase family protein n=1 Tax=Streptomyces catenulae TaxID=66875 RepID=A0ABV2YTS8_9ACTN|nr:aminoglycoside phosphotransferase family protein [Streptomyces catenulae]
MDDTGGHPATDRFPPGLTMLRTVRRTADGRSWLARLPELVRAAEERWGLRLGAPYDGGSCSWVAPATLPDGAPAVLKVGLPHREADGEAPALRAWAGEGAVRLLDHDPALGALLIERCAPGTPLAAAPLPPEERLTLAAEVLRGLWAVPRPADGGPESMVAVCDEWAALVEERAAHLPAGYDAGLVALGARLLRTLPRGARRTAVVHGDANPGNLLAARRRPWLAIDPKPMTGDPAYDPWPLLLQIDDPFTHPDPGPVLHARARLLGAALAEDPARLLAWAAARGVESALHEAAHGDPAGGADALRRAWVAAELAGC